MEKEVPFNVFPINYKDTGWSSICGEGRIDTMAAKVRAIRMDKFMEQNNIDKIDFLKIDVEGCSYEVLEGFGNRLADVNCIQLEAEHGKNDFPVDWALYDKIEYILKQHGFELILFERKKGMRQSDSFYAK